ncbi:MAG: GNAT family N-acetyltransferase [Actinomycetota bacterium]|nr:GNAT family N-acetyltransferase [Actinomycetota bacterium]
MTAGPEIRGVRLPADAQELLRIDAGFSCDVGLQVRRDGDSFVLAEQPLEPAVTKQFPLDEALAQAGTGWDCGFVAALGGSLCGFAATAYHDWNRRLQLCHLYVDRGARRRGVARALVEAVLVHGRQTPAAHLWLETSNVNQPAVSAYRKLGFEICGLDTTLYDGTGARGEVALYLSRPLV